MTLGVHRTVQHGERVLCIGMYEPIVFMCETLVGFDMFTSTHRPLPAAGTSTTAAGAILLAVGIDWGCWSWRLLSSWAAGGTR